MKKSELKVELKDCQEKLKAAYQEISELKLLIKASQIIDDEEEKAQCAIDLEKVAAAL